MAIRIHIDAHQFDRLGNLIGAAGKKAPHALRRAINHTGDKARTQVRKVLVKQTGLKYRTIVKAVRSTRSSYKSGSYVLKAAGGDIRLRFFGPRETRKGVSAAPWNRRQVFPGSFMKGGRFPKRVPLKSGKAVFRRTGKSRFPVKEVRSGLFIGEEMISGASEQAFFDTAQRELPPRVAHELYRVLG